MQSLGPSASLVGTEDAPEEVEGDPDAPGPAANIYIVVEFSSIPPISCAAQIYEQEQKFTCKNLGHYRCCVIIQNI
jgi:hypothetical protein